ncbi:MAG: hypothetical protein KDJ46_03925 [Rhodobiaceae bacterium]|nr:hypothetical protein [Rhodobiaceae bacterium]
MSSWSSYKEKARLRGALALEFFVVESMPNASPEEMQKFLADHLAYQKKIEAAGILFLAGPLSDASGEEMSGGGMMVYRANSMDQAHQIAREDPMHANGARVFAIRRWLVNEGSFSSSVTLSDQSATLK